MGQRISCLCHHRDFCLNIDSDTEPLLYNAAPMATSPPILIAPTNIAPEPASKSANLEPYVHAALRKVHGPSSGRIFRSSPDFTMPQLTKGAVNPILLFPGSFNLVHVGHKLFPTHDFFRSHLDNVVAAITSPNSTEFVRKKLVDEPNALIMSRVERGRLWQDHMLTPWSLVYSNVRRSDNDFKNALIKATAAEGYVIEFVLVMGGDILKDRRAHDSLQSHEFRQSIQHTAISDHIQICVIFSNGLRSTPQYRGGSLLSWGGYNAWTRSEEADIRILAMLLKGEYSALAVLTLLYPREGERVVHGSDATGGVEERALVKLYGCLRESGTSWICTREQDPQVTAQFVQSRNAIDKGMVPGLSSTGLRAIIRNVKPKQRLNTIDGLAMNALLLSKYVTEHEREASRRAPLSPSQCASSGYR